MFDDIPRTVIVMGQTATLVPGKGIRVSRDFLNTLIGPAGAGLYTLTAEFIDELHRAYHKEVSLPTPVPTPVKEEADQPVPRQGSLLSLISNLEGLAQATPAPAKKDPAVGTDLDLSKYLDEVLDIESEAGEEEEEEEPKHLPVKPVEPLSVEDMDDDEYKSYLLKFYSDKYRGPDPDRIPTWRVDGHMMSEDQIAAVKTFVKGTGQIYALTGPAGSGKSAVVNFLRAHYAGLEVTATTGKAAMPINGTTIDSFASMQRPNRRADDQVEEPQYKVRNQRTLDQNFQNLRYLIIDEASMIGLNMGNFLYTKVFDGRHLLKVLLVGDWAQAAPVDDGWPMGGQLLERVTWLRLTKVHRQSDAAFLKALDEVRHGLVSDESVELFKTRVQATPPDDDSYIRMYATNKRADLYNRERLAAHCRTAEGSPFELRTVFADRRSPRQQTSYPRNDQFKSRKIEDSRMAHREMFAIGAKVLFTFNDPGDLGVYVNGDTATILDAWNDKGESLKGFRHDGFSPMPAVRTISFRLDRNGYEFSLSPQVREVETAGRSPDYALTGFPIKLGWALTIHKAQGMSVHHSWVDMSTILHHPEETRHGLAYVALSRARTLEGLLISKWVPEAIQCYEGVRPLL